jgi:hypothetical protein
MVWLHLSEFLYALQLCSLFLVGILMEQASVEWILPENDNAPLLEMIALRICKYWRSAKPCFLSFRISSFEFGCCSQFCGLETRHHGFSTFPQNQQCLLLGFNRNGWRHAVSYFFAHPLNDASSE